MKKIIFALLSLCMALSLVLVNSQAAQAYDLPAPSVTPVSGDLEFTATPTAISRLPGVIPNDNGIILPVGFPSGTAQFSGEGMLVKDFTMGTATLCFAAPAAQSEWVGTIHEWKDEKWTRMPTSVTQGSVEDTTATACTTIYSNGTFAMIMGYTGKPEPKNILPVCDPDVMVSTLLLRFAADPPIGMYHYLTPWMFINTPLPIGTPVSYSIFNVQPAGILTGQGLSRTGFVDISEATLSVVTLLDLSGPIDPLHELPAGFWVHVPTTAGNISFTMRVTLPACYVDLDFQVPPDEAIWFPVDSFLT